MKEAKKIAAML